MSAEKPAGPGQAGERTEPRPQTKSPSSPDRLPKRTADACEIPRSGASVHGPLFGKTSRHHQPDKRTSARSLRNSPTRTRVEAGQPINRKHFRELPPDQRLQIPQYLKTNISGKGNCESEKANRIRIPLFSLSPCKSASFLLRMPPAAMALFLVGGFP